MLFCLYQVPLDTPAVLERGGFLVLRAPVEGLEPQEPGGPGVTLAVRDPGDQREALVDQDLLVGTVAQVEPKRAWETVYHSF